MAGGIAGSIATGGAAAPWLIPAASAVGQAWEAHDAEKKGQKQQQAGYQQAINAYQPFYNEGVGAAHTLAGYLGIPESQAPMAGGGGGAPMASAPTLNPNGLFARLNAVKSAQQDPQTLQGLLARYQPDANAPAEGQRSMSRPQTPSAKSRSSYRAEAN
jgi:hypothetical protein